MTRDEGNTASTAWVIVGSTGAYEDVQWWCVRVFDTESAAVSYHRRLLEYCDARTDYPSLAKELRAGLDPLCEDIDTNGVYYGIVRAPFGPEHWTKPTDPVTARELARKRIELTPEQAQVIIDAVDNPQPVPRLREAVERVLASEATDPVLRALADAEPDDEPFTARAKAVTDDIVRDIETAARELRALGPVAVRVLAPAEVLLHLRGQLVTTPLAAARGGSPGSGIELAKSDEDLPAWTCRVEYSDGTSELVKLR